MFSTSFWLVVPSFHSAYPKSKLLVILFGVILPPPIRVLVAGLKTPLLSISQPMLGLVDVIPTLITP